MKAETKKGSFHNVLFGGEMPEKKELVYKVETLNKEKGIVTTLRKTAQKREYTVCLFLPKQRVVSTVLHSRVLANELMGDYRKLYKGLESE